VVICDTWFSPGTLASSTNKTGRHDIAEILPKVTLNTIKKKIKSSLHGRQQAWRPATGSSL
jgi:hypothetical protein